jgi:hypothetical protein
MSARSPYLLQHALIMAAVVLFLALLIAAPLWR